MDGLLVINKEKDFTSHDVCNKLRRILNTKKIGHTGTLDPLATGVMVVGVGRATKLIQYLENQVKRYVAEIKLGIETDTYDITGKVLAEKDPSTITEAMIDEAILKLEKETLQYPPIYSAIKVNGRKLYDYARDNLEVEIKPRPIKIYEAKRLTPIIKKADGYYLSVELLVSKGFYVRSFIHDLGRLLESYAIMSNLKRTEAGDFKITEAQTLDEVKEDGPKLISLETLALKYQEVKVNEFFKRLVLNGVVLDARFYKGDDLFRVTYQDKLIAIYAPTEKKYRYKPVLILGDEDGNI